MHPLKNTIRGRKKTQIVLQTEKGFKTDSTEIGILIQEDGKIVRREYFTMKKKQFATSRMVSREYTHNTEGVTGKK